MKTEVTMYTLAEELNMSVAAISRAFNPNSKIRSEKRELILQTASRMGYVPNTMASRLSQKPIQIGVLIYGYMRVYDDEILAGIRSAYSELRGYKVNCDIRRFYDGETTIDMALNVLDEFKEKQYDGVLISKLPEQTVTGKINELDEAGIKTVVFDADIPSSKRLFVSMNNVDIATNMVADLLRMSIPQNPRIAVFFVQDQETLISDFQQHAADNGLQIVAQQKLSLRDTDEGRKENVARVKALFEQHPEVNGAYISCANCLPVCEYLVESGRHICLIASDIFDEMRQYIANGVIDASIYQNPFSQGYEAVKNLYYYLAEKREVPEQLLAHPQIILKSNMMLF